MCAVIARVFIMKYVLMKMNHQPSFTVINCYDSET